MSCVTVKCASSLALGRLLHHTHSPSDSIPFPLYISLYWQHVPTPSNHDNAMTTQPLPEFQIYPAYTFRASPTFFAWVKLTAADIHQLRTEKGFEGRIPVSTSTTIIRLPSRCVVRPGPLLPLQSPRAIRQSHRCDCRRRRCRVQIRTFDTGRWKRRNHRRQNYKTSPRHCSERRVSVKHECG
jgi:hypothetical protein